MYHQIDAQGFYVGVSSLENNTTMEFYTEVPITGNFLRHRIVNNVWVEGATDEELAAAKKASVPSEVPLWSMRILLKKMQLFDSIIKAINQMNDPLKSMALDYLEYGNFIERNSNTVILIQQILQMTDTQVDNLFIDASNLKL